MKGRKRGQQGFTLIEVLIVVIIIGVLAALIIPRFLTAPEKAIVAEANQTLGSLIRGQQGVMDMGGSFVAGSPLTTANWQSIGMNVPVASSKFTYGCTSPTCSATRTVNSTASTAALNASTQGWTCTGAYTPMSNGGCTLA